MSKRILQTVLVLFFLLLSSLINVKDSFASGWENVGDEGFNSGGNIEYISLKFNPSTNEPFVAFRDGGNSNKATVMKFSGGSWQNVGTSGFSTGEVLYTSLAFNPSTNEPYVAFSDASNLNKATVMKFSSGTWQVVGTAGFSVGDAFTLSLAFNLATNEPYVAYEDKGISWKATVMKFSEGSWQNVGTAGISEDGAGYYTSLAFNPSTNEPYIAYEDGGNSNKVTVKKFNGISWQTVGNIGFAGGNSEHISLAFNPVTIEPYVAFSDGSNSSKATVMKFSEGSWQTVGSAGISVANAFTLSLAFSLTTNEPYVAYEDQGISWKATVMKFSEGSWQTVGSAGISDGGGYYTSLAFNPSTKEPYLAYEDGDNLNKITVRKSQAQIVKPTASPAGGNYTSNQSVTLSTTTSGATIYYTTDGSTPTTSSNRYSSALTVSSNINLKAIATKSGMTDSNVMSESYTINIPGTVAIPTASPAGGTYTSSQSVILSTNTSGATIYYTIDGSSPTSASNVYSSPISISNSINLKAVAIKSGMFDSPVLNENYTISVNTDTPTLSYSISKKAKKRISYTFKNLSLTQKKYVTVKIGGRKVKVIRVRRSGSDSIVTVELKYAKWGRGNYSLIMNYKNQTKVAYKTKKGKNKYKKGWERGAVNSEKILSIQ